MLKKKIRLFTCGALCLAVLAGCGGGSNADKNAETTPGAEQANAEYVDYASSITLDLNSSTKKQEVTVKTFVDGDTTHFNVPANVSSDGLLKARYIAVNTPESTGKIEEYGKTASNFTKEKLSSATSIIVESDTNEWNMDSTGGRLLVWVWYRTSDTEEYRNLNIELLQNGLAIASSSANNRYGLTAVAAIDNAKALKLNIYSGQKDPNFFYGDAVELTLNELRTHTSDYSGMKVAFEGVITRNGDNSVYIEEYDEETGLYYGIMVYYGFGLNGSGLSILSVGNRVRIVGTLQYYETGGTYQIAGVSYREMKPNDPGNIQKLGEGYSPAYVETSADTFVNGTVKIEVDGEEKEFDYAFLTLDTTISMKDLKVKDVYTTSNKESSSYGAMTLTCEAEDGTVVTVRTNVLFDENKNMITEDAYLGKNIDVKGLVAYFSGSYQIKVLTASDITVNN
ncbi:MAG: thermonuclease family protein [Lachnospiraceae bacterium]|nr:thermonuclease family protein [Lachnospiraceae bacterium]